MRWYVLKGKTKGVADETCDGHMTKGIYIYTALNIDYIAGLFRGGEIFVYAEQI